MDMETEIFLTEVKKKIDEEINRFIENEEKRTETLDIINGKKLSIKLNTKEISIDSTLSEINKKFRESKKEYEVKIDDKLILEGRIENIRKKYILKIISNEYEWGQLDSEIKNIYLWDIETLAFFIADKLADKKEGFPLKYFKNLFNECDLEMKIDEPTVDKYLESIALGVEKNKIGPTVDKYLESIAIGVEENKTLKKLESRHKQLIEGKIVDPNKVYCFEVNLKFSSDKKMLTTFFKKLTKNKYIDGNTSIADIRRVFKMKGDDAKEAATIVWMGEPPELAYLIKYMCGKLKKQKQDTKIIMKAKDHWEVTENCFFNKEYDVKFDTKALSNGHNPKSDAIKRLEEIANSLKKNRAQ